jgi:hypothetical protein
MENKHADIFEFIYFGSPHQLVNLTKVKGKKFEYKRDMILNDNTNQSRASALAYKFPLTHLGKDYNNFYISPVSANDVYCKFFDSELEECKNDESNIIDNCVIKTKTFNEGGFFGYQSGARSAIININGKHYRLKGCGNFENGFNERFMGFPKDCKDVRGCQFRNTTFREVYFSDTINEILKKFGYEVANKPIGVWLYSEDIRNDELGILNDKPKVEKFCSVYQVIGEKRLGCHVMPSLELLLGEMTKDLIKKDIDFETILLNMFEKGRFVKTKQGDYEINPTCDYAPIIELNKNEGDRINSIFDKYNIYSQHQPELFDITKSECNNEILSFFGNSKSFEEIYKNYLEQFEIGKLYDNIQADSIEKITNKLNEFITKIKDDNLFSLLGLFYSRAGWEVGRIKRIMQDNNINWGTYEDLKFRLHCNAHTDNYVIYPRNKSKNLLTPLDFDLAFFKENFISLVNDTEEDQETYGKFDDYLYDMFLNIERQSLEWELAGSENMQIFDYYSNLFKDNKTYELLFKSLLYMLRDTSIIYYRMGYMNMDYHLQNKYEENYDKLYDLIELGLVIGFNFHG